MHRSHFAQYVAIELCRFRRAQSLNRTFAAFYVAFVEMFRPKFYFVGHIPAFVIGNALVDVVQQPCQYGRRGVSFSIMLSTASLRTSALFSSNVQVGTEFQFAGKVAHDRTGKRVDCFHAEAAVIVQHILQCHSGALAQLPVGRGRFPASLPNLL